MECLFILYLSYERVTLFFFFGQRGMFVPNDCIQLKDPLALVLKPCKVVVEKLPRVVMSQYLKYEGNCVTSINKLILNECTQCELKDQCFGTGQNSRCITPCDLVNKRTSKVLLQSNEGLNTKDFRNTKDIDNEYNAEQLDDCKDKQTVMNIPYFEHKTDCNVEKNVVKDVENCNISMDYCHSEVLLKDNKTSLDQYDTFKFKQHFVNFLLQKDNASDNLCTELKKFNFKLLKFSCVQCDSTFLNNKELYHHLCKGKRKKGFVCNFCEKIFKTLVILEKHMGNVHCLYLNCNE